MNFKRLINPCAPQKNSQILNRWESTTREAGSRNKVREGGTQAAFANRNQNDQQSRLLLSFANSVRNERLPSEQIVNASKTA
jgi:hypothetical protein